MAVICCTQAARSFAQVPERSLRQPLWLRLVSPEPLNPARAPVWPSRSAVSFIPVRLISYTTPRIEFPVSADGPVSFSLPCVRDCNFLHNSLLHCRIHQRPRSTGEVVETHIRRHLVTSSPFVSRDPPCAILELPNITLAGAFSRPRPILDLSSLGPRHPSARIHRQPAVAVTAVT